MKNFTPKNNRAFSMNYNFPEYLIDALECNDFSNLTEKEAGMVKDFEHDIEKEGYQIDFEYGEDVSVMDPDFQNHPPCNCIILTVNYESK